jgi:uncharacterized coiled-coil protein SlyX
VSKVDNTVDDAKKLAMRCKALEAQLRQSITKKEHHQIVLEFEEKMTDMERKIADQEKTIVEDRKELERTRSELQKANVLNKQFGEVGGQVAALSNLIAGQGKTVDSLVSKISGAVPTAVHQQSLAKVKELEERIGGMVSRSEYAALESRYEEAEKHVAEMVPKEDHEALRQKSEELGDTISGMVPMEQFNSSEARVRELEATLAGRIPQSVYDELVSKVVQLAADVTGGGPITAEPELPQVTPVEPAAPAPVSEPIPATPSDTVIPSAPISQEPSAVESIPETGATPEVSVPTVENSSDPEITEIGSQLAEIKTDAFTEPNPTEVSPEPAPLSPESPEALGEETAEPVEGPTITVKTVEEQKVQNG